MIPEVQNEVVLSYAPGSKERKSLREVIAYLKENQQEVCMRIGGSKVRSESSKAIYAPHDHALKLGHYFRGTASHVEMAIRAAMDAKEGWESMPWKDRAAIFLKAADLLSTKYRAKQNAMTMLGQSKNIFQAEIDAVCEFCDFLRFNVKYLTEIYAQQPSSSPFVWNQLEYRPLEGFVFALTPFNFTSIAGNLPCAPALMGNVVVWKPAETQIYSASLIMDILEEAGLPPGVINLVFVDGPTAGNAIFSNPDFAGLHFTGSTGVFKSIWKTVAANLDIYKSFPRLVGETGGKDFVIAHVSADPKALSVALARGAFEFQGQKCSAASRAYIPKSIWPQVKANLISDLSSMKIGGPDDFENFINAVIDEKAFLKIENYIEKSKSDPSIEVIFGGRCDKSKGYFIEPTVLQTNNARSLTMCEEIFGPVLTIFVYDDDQFDETLTLVDTTSPYALTGAVFAKDRQVILKASEKLSNAAGNFYINDKPTGAVVGQQPFGGARASGTNDKAGSALNLLRWVSPRTIKENFCPPHEYGYPFLEKD
ncbi:MAG: L-glutamate gamma-semialdehyde dehydrogenase [Saprospiraceae bacterium]|nr:L-glutamate gamma-semialdehyde dehydrogenase [Saprospiraceae bacterium]MBV6471982.1 1-pyrroline-5-carboxylate dehydrogenase 2 [Saprospiraceae bacterium]